VKNEEENVFAPMPDPFRRGVNCSKDQKKKKKKKKKKMAGVDDICHKLAFWL
jgi:hypothetical protein